MRVLYTMICGITLAVLLVMVVCWLGYRDACFAKIKFKDFRKYYALAPERWYCHDPYVEYELFNGGSQCFYFGFVDFYKYLLWKYKIDKTRERKRHDESIHRFLDDINRLENNKND